MNLAAGNTDGQRGAEIYVAIKGSSRVRFFSGSTGILLGEIFPFVANSPVMSFFYAEPAPEYRKHMNKEGELIPANRAWHEANRTYLFSYGLGSLIVLFGLLIAAHWWRPEIGALGSFMVIGMSFVTLSFLVTTPECWVPDLGDAQHGFPYLSGRGRLVIKDAIMMGAALVTMADSAKAYLRKRATAAAQAI